MKPNVHKRNKQQQRSRSRPRGLSLEAFTNAKQSGALTVKEIRKKREFYQNAKKVQNYRKLLKRLGEDGDSVAKHGASFVEPDVEKTEQGDEGVHIRNNINGHSPDNSNTDVFRQRRLSGPSGGAIDDDTHGDTRKADSIGKLKKRKPACTADVRRRGDAEPGNDFAQRMNGGSRSEGYGFGEKERRGAQNEGGAAAREAFRPNRLQTSDTASGSTSEGDSDGNTCNEDVDMSGLQRGGGGNKGDPQQRKKRKGMSRMAREIKKLEEKKAEEEAARRAQAAAAEERRKIREERASQRRDMSLKMRKKTRRGQPIMKHRVDKLLDQIQRQT